MGSWRPEPRSGSQRGQARAVRRPGVAVRVAARPPGWAGPELGAICAWLAMKQRAGVQMVSHLPFLTGSVPREAIGRGRGQAFRRQYAAGGGGGGARPAETEISVCLGLVRR